MTPFLQLAIELVIIILFAKAAGYLSTRIGRPVVFGELNQPNTGILTVIPVARAYGMDRVFD